MDKLISKVLETISKHNLIIDGEGLLVGLSGGPDSVCLVHVLLRIKENTGINVFAAHVNHMLRGDESARDEEYVAQFCIKHGVRLMSQRIDVGRISSEKKISLEEAGREARYSYFRECTQKLGLSKIAVAHNRNDQVETILMNIMRGTGLDGLKGMDYKNGDIIRPLLDIERSEIVDYLKEEGIESVLDSSNLETKYTRNKFRMEIIPAINNALNTSITGAVTKMSSLVRDDLRILDSMSIKLYSEITKSEDGTVELNISRIQRLEIGLLRRIVRLAISEVTGNLSGISNIHVDSVIDSILNGRTGSELHLPGELRVARSYDLVRFYKKASDTKVKEELCLEITIPGTTELVWYGQSASISAEVLEFEPSARLKSEEDNTKHFDYDLLKKGIYIRSRKNGDVIKPLKSIGTKKLKEYLIDRKVPREKRDEMLYVASDNEIVWIIGGTTSDKFRVTENTKLILRLEFVKHNQ